MLTSQRRQYLLDTLRTEGQIVAKELSQRLALSEDTIRRDLRELAAEGLVQRVHGGALPVSPAIADFAGRLQLGSDGKRAIGKAAAAMIVPGQVVLLDGGTTALQVARHLAKDLRATIVTHSPSIAVELSTHPSVEVVLIGGRLFKHSIVAVGAAAQDAIRRIRADVYFMGVTGIHPAAGLTTGDFEEAAIKQSLSQSAAETIVLGSAEKIGTASAYLVLPLSAASAIITDPSVPDAQIKPFSELGVTIIRAS